MILIGVRDTDQLARARELAQERAAAVRLHGARSGTVTPAPREIPSSVLDRLHTPTGPGPGGQQTSGGGRRV